MKWTIRGLLMLVTLVLGVMTSCLVISVLLLKSKLEDQREAEESRYRSTLLANELRQSSDDLTRLVRTYAQTGDPIFEAQYNDVLAIRNGLKARPLEYNRIYWDFMAVSDTPPRGNGQAISLKDMMKQAGFTSNELDALTQAQANSDRLVKTEIIAFNAVKGLFADSSGRFTITGTPNLDLARGILFDKQYHQDKAAIMSGIDKFYKMMELRTQKKIEGRKQNSELWLSMTISIILLLGITIVTSFWFLYKRLHQMLGAEPAYTINAVKNVARGNLATPIGVDNQDTQSLLYNVKIMSSHLSEALLEVSSVAGTIDIASTQLSVTAESLSLAACEQAESLDKSSSSIEEIVSFINANASNAEQTEKIALNASLSATHCSQHMNKLLLAIQEISSRVSVIHEISHKTDLLAINAAIEAARAGEGGKGFATVASEVRKLAEKSSRAALEIGQVCASVQGLSDEVDSIIKSMLPGITQTTSLVKDISASLNEQRYAINEINQATFQTNGMMQSSVATAEELSSTAEELRSTAQQLLGLLRQFKLRP
ncbi:methyl-accepting chemotaxis protein [Aeromonas veronii]